MGRLGHPGGDAVAADTGLLHVIGEPGAIKRVEQLYEYSAPPFSGVVSSGRRCGMNGRFPFQPGWFHRHT
jgi:hypothetical protein